MSDTIDIGAARVRLIVDAADFDSVVAQGKNAVRGFGDAAQQSYDRTEKATRRAADALLDYVSGLGRADTSLDKYIRNASRLGVEKTVIDAATQAWAKHQAVIEDSKSAQAGYNELVRQAVANEKAAQAAANAAAQSRFENLSAARAAQSQQDINALVAPGLSVNTDNTAHRLAAEEVFAELVAKQNAELAEQKVLEEAISTARAEQHTTNAQQDFNKLLGIPEQQEALALAQRRRDAEAAFGPVLQREADLMDEAFAHNGKVDAFIAQLKNLESTAGKSYYELLQLKAAELGVSGSADPLIAKIKAQNQAMGAGTISARQYEFALRGLPAQFTDVVVSLQAGQNPLTVLLQQGGQVKDMFGGVGSAVRAVGSQLVKLATNPWFLLAGAIAAIAAAAYSATSRVEALSLATAKGNLVAGNAQGLSSLAEQLSKLDHISLGNADAAVASLAEAGVLTGKNFEEAAQAAARWASITGEKVDDIAGKFNALARDPMAAVLDGTLRVTAAQYAQLEALDRVGKKAEESALAVKLYQDQVNANSDAVLANLSAGERGWIALKDAISDAAHSLAVFSKEFLGSAFNKFKAPTLRDLASAGTGGEGMLDLLNQSDALAQAPSGATPTGGNVTRSGFGGVGTDAAAATIANTTQLTRDQAQANVENQKAIDELGTKSQKYTVQLAQLNAQLSRSNDEFLRQNNITRGANGKFSGAGYDKLVNGLRLKVFGENQGGDPTRPIKQWEKTALDTIKNVGAGIDYLYQDARLTAEDYYSVETGLAKSSEVIQLQSIDKQIAALKGRANSEAQVAALQEQRYTVEQEYAGKKAAIDRAEVLAIRAREIALRNYSDALAEANIQLARQGQQDVRGVGMGTKETGLANAQDNARYATQKAIDDINKQVADSTLNSADADKKKQEATAALTTQLSLLESNYRNINAAEANFLNGSTKAWQDWSDSVANYAQQAGAAVTGVLNDAVDALTRTQMEGNFSLNTLFKNLEKQILEFANKQLVKTLTQSIFGSSAGGSGEGWAATLTKLFSSFGSSSSGSSAGAGDYSAAGLALAFKSAKGNAFASSAGLANYSGSVVSQPTYFPFARGGVPNVGLMGEKAGSPGEAIMPLTRTSGGELAVKAVGQQQPKVTTVNQVFVVPGAVTRQTQDQLAIKQGGAAQRAARRS